MLKTYRITFWLRDDENGSQMRGYAGLYSACHLGTILAESCDHAKDIAWKQFKEALPNMIDTVAFLDADEEHADAPPPSSKERFESQGASSAENSLPETTDNTMKLIAGIAVGVGAAALGAWYLWTRHRSGERAHESSIVGTIAQAARDASRVNISGRVDHNVSANVKHDITLR